MFARQPIFCVLFLGFFLPWAFSMPSGVNGGIKCLGCTAVVSINQQLAEHWNITFEESWHKLCSFLPKYISSGCSILGDFFLPIIKPHQFESPDLICHAIDVCYTEKDQNDCKAYPNWPPTNNKKVDFDFIEKVKKVKKSIRDNTPDSKFKDIHKKLYNDWSGFGVPEFDICTITGIHEICKWLEHVFSQDLPILDIDGDRFSAYETLRGFAWRGKDCNDLLSHHYPGRKPISEDIFFDSNCNGISGFNLLEWKAWEEILCKETPSLGTIVLGDSIAAHFRIPPEWLTATEINQTIFRDLVFVLQNEFDWPMMSGYTGYLDKSEWPHIITGPVDSIYKHVVQRNLCNHRDYQNIGKNGANSFDMNNVLVKALSRNGTTDQPALVFYSLFGNDVCKSDPHGGNMTSVEEMRENALKTLDTFDKMLAKGSHVAMLGLADGRILFESMHNRIHPIGQLRKDVTYGQLYDFMNCLQISPCAGWLNSNETIRNATTTRAKELSNVLEEIAATREYKNFDLAFIENFFEEVIHMWHESGSDHETWQLIEPVGGFHPNQNALALSAKVLIKTMESKVPHFLGDVNPHNHIIKKVFGDQGGYT